MNKIADAIRQYPAGAFVASLVLHGVVWTALPALFFLNLPLDLIEGLLYGREWQLGYDKLPPMPWWMVDAAYRMFGPDLFFYAMSQAMVLSAFALIWVMARCLVGPVGALAAVLIIDGLHYFTFTAPKFNHDVVQLPFWALAGYAYWAALRHGRIVHWLLLGSALGMAVWAKYFVVVLAAPLMLFALFDRDARKVLRTPGPYVAAAIAVLVALPHLIWLVQNDFLPFAYADARARPFKSGLDYAVKPAMFLLGQIGAFVPSLLIALPCVWKRAPAADDDGTAPSAFDRRIVTLLAFGPAVFVVLLSLVTGRDVVSMWGYPLWLFTGLWIVLQVKRPDALALGRMASVWAAVAAIYAGAFVWHFGVRPRLQVHYTTELFPGQRLGDEMSRRFRVMTGRPLSYVIASMWVGGNVGHYAPERPRVLIDGRPARAPWIDLGDLRSRGAVVVWPEHESPGAIPPGLRAIAEDAEIQPPFTLPMRLGQGTASFGWAVLRPRPVVAALKPAP
ncbi:MAG: glycosyltransferase family 39 protein [Alphaproteobacteria bacterium]|nr:glycosyltransferase family 39 protein [Alphaproteobacteria bacterium]